MMLVLDARFTLLAVLCCLSTHWLSPSATATAAVISRNYETTASPFRGVDDPANSHSQHVLPWSRSNPGESRSRDGWLNSRIHKVRFEDLSPTNPVQRFADALFYRLLQRRRSPHRRSHKTIVIPNDHGSLYLLSHARRADTPQWISNPPSNGTSAQTNATTAETSSASKGVPGTVHIQSHMDNAEDRSIASLFLQHVEDQYVLNASENDATQLYMVNAPTSTTREAVASSSNADTPVYLTIPSLADSKDYCATYNPNPTKAEPMTMEPCVNYNAADETSTQQASQTFMYNQTSGQIRPTWFAGQDDGTNDGTIQAVSSEPNNSTTSSSNGTLATPNGQATFTTLSSRDGPSPNAHNVTLIFVPSGKAVAADVPQNAAASSSAVTTTMTQTVTVFATGSISSSYTSSAGTPSASQSALNVEVVGGTPTLSSSSSPTSSSAVAMDVASSSVVRSSAYPSSSINAYAVASSIAASFSAAMASASASSSSSLAAADISASPSSTSGTTSSTYVAAVLGRAAWVKAADENLTSVSTDPYRWKFQAEDR